MKYLKYFKTTAELDSYNNSGEKYLPNVIYVENNETVIFNPLNSPKVTLYYNNLIGGEVLSRTAFNDGSNIKSLKIDGVQIPIEPVTVTTLTNTFIGSEVSLTDINNFIGVYPMDYLKYNSLKGVTITPTDSSVIFDEYTCVCMLIVMEGMSGIQPLVISEEVEHGILIVNNNSVSFNDFYAADFDNLLQQIGGISIGLILMQIKDIDSFELEFLDTTVTQTIRSGGLPMPYEFNTDGEHIVEMELLNDTFGSTNMFISSDDEANTALALNKVVLNDDVKNLASNTFSQLTFPIVLELNKNINYLPDNLFKNSGHELIFKGELPEYRDTIFGENNTKAPILSLPYNIALNADFETHPWMSKTVGTPQFLGYYHTEVDKEIRLCNLDNMLVVNLTAGSGVPIHYYFNLQKQNVNSYNFNNIYGAMFSVGVSDSVLHEGAFADCDSLFMLGLSYFTHIGKDAFKNCSSLSAIQVITCIYDAPSLENDNVFDGLPNNGELVVPEMLIDIYKTKWKPLLDKGWIITGQS